MNKPKLFRICPAPFHINEARALHRLDQRPFWEQIELLRKENLLLPGGWSSAMTAEGFEVFETIYSDLSLQLQWCRENKPRIPSLSNIYTDLYFQILKEQVRLFEPNIVYIYAGGLMFVPPKYRKELRAISSKGLIITGYWGDELPSQYSYDGFFGDLDFVFCSSSVYREKFAAAGIESVVIGNCFDDTIECRGMASKVRDFVFTGTTGYGFPDHVGRYEKLVALTARSNLEIWANEPDEIVDRDQTKHAQHVVRSFVTRLLSAIIPLHLLGHPANNPTRPYLAKILAATLAVWNALSRGGQRVDSDSAHSTNYFVGKKPLKALFPEQVHPLLPNCSDYYQLVQESKLFLNIHRDEDADIGNIRCFEVTGLGSCLVTDRGFELREFFDIDNDLMAFDNVDDCLKKVEFLLAHPEEIDRIAANGRRTTLSRHTIGHRAKAIAEHFRELLGAKIGEPSKDTRCRPNVEAIYDIKMHQTPHHFGAFLQAAAIFREITDAAELTVSIARSIADSTTHSLLEMTELARNLPSLRIVNSHTANIAASDRVSSHAKAATRILPFPGPDVSHHSAFYRLINANPDIVPGFCASDQARQHADEWLKSAGCRPHVLCITVRQHEADPRRNCNLIALEAFLGRVNPSEFSVVYVRDTDSATPFKDKFLERYPIFPYPIVNSDARNTNMIFGLYEASYLNIFLNNEFSLLATMNKKIRYLMFKVAAAQHDDVPIYSNEHFNHFGFQVGAAPYYASEFQKWVWSDDNTETLWREFCLMNELIKAKTLKSTC